MTVYLLVVDNIIVDGDLVGVFSSKEKAMEYAKKKKYLEELCNVIPFEVDNPKITY